MDDVKIGTYKHYKGTIYEVVGFALDTESQEKLVLYHGKENYPELTSEYGNKPLFARPYRMFIEKVTVGTTQVPRFEFIKNNNE